MKKFIISVLVAMVTGVLSFGAMSQDCSASEWAVSQAAPKKELKTVTFSVSMHCHNCVKKLNENLSVEKGVKSLEVSLEAKTVKITYDPSKTDVATLQKAIEKFGYTVKVI